MGKLQRLHEKARAHPEHYWGKIAEGIFWFKRRTTVLDSTNAPFYKWFCGPRLQYVRAWARYAECDKSSRLRRPSAP